MKMGSDAGILIVLERKLVQRLREVDDETLSAIRSTWKTITPAPTCPAISDVMTAIKTACADGIRKRSAESIRVISETLSTYPGTLSRDNVASSKKNIRKLFPNDLYITAAGNTAGVFQRQQAPKLKFSERQFELDMASVAVDSANRTRSAVQKIHTCLDEFASRKAPVESTASLQPTSLSRGDRLRHFWYAHWQWLIGTLLLGVLGIVFSWMSDRG